MSHEIRTPMNAIMGFADLLSNKNIKPEKLELYTHIIKQRCSDLLDIINDLLDIAKIESGQISLHQENFSLAVLFDELNHIFSEQINGMKNGKVLFRIKHHINIDNITVYSDIVKLKQIFFNLLNNALKYTELGKIECGCLKINDNQLTFYVSDTGIGIPEDKHQKIFDRFIQLDSKLSQTCKGTGLGLSIIKGLLELLQGSIWLESKLNQGTTFYFTIRY